MDILVSPDADAASVATARRISDLLRAPPCAVVRRAAQSCRSMSPYARVWHPFPPPSAASIWMNMSVCPRPTRNAIPTKCAVRCSSLCPCLQDGGICPTATRPRPRSRALRRRDHGCGRHRPATAEAALPNVEHLPLLVWIAIYVFSPGIWWIGSRMNRSGSDVQILQMYS